LKDLEDDASSNDDDAEDFSIPKQMFINKETFGPKLYIVTNNYENEFLDYVATFINDAENDVPAPAPVVVSSYSTPILSAAAAPTLCSVGYAVNSTPAPAPTPSSYSYGLYNEPSEGNISSENNEDSSEGPNNEDSSAENSSDDEENTSTSTEVDEFNLSF
jgi:hypothetical protein